MTVQESQDLRNHIQELIEIHKELLELAEEKKQAVIGDRIDDLSRIVNRETRQVRKLEALEQQWQSMSMRATRELGLGRRLTLEEWIRHAGGTEEEKLVLQRAQQELADLVSQLKKANELNQELIQHSLAFVNYSLDLMTGFNEDFATYDRPDGKSRNARRGVFDAQV